MTEIKSGLSTEFISHPGETLEELLEQYGISQKELAAKIDTSEKHINEVIKGKKNITVSFAKKLENVLPPKASFWINRQNIYDEKIESIRIRENISSEEKEAFRKIPFKELVNYGYVKEERNDVENILNLRNFLSSSNLTNIPNILNVILPSISFKMDYTSALINPYRLYSWLRICQIEVEKIYNPNDYSVDKLKNSLYGIKKCSMLDDFQEAYEKVKTILFDCGINFKIVRNLESNPVQGYIRTVNNNISLCVTLKWKVEDVFWFTLFHELGHLVQKKNNRVFVDFYNEEIEANEFAKNTLIDKRSWNKLVSTKISEKTIRECAKENSICPAIVVGRLKKEKYIDSRDSSFNFLQRKINYKD